MGNKTRIYKPIDALDAKMWRQYRHAAVCLSNDNLARYDALGNRIYMKMTFDEWKAVWLNSGFYHLRGRKQGCYVMARRYDIGHYELGNVDIVPIHLNQNQAHKGRKVSDIAKQKMSISRSKEKHPLYGKKHKPESIIKMSISAKNRIRNMEAGRAQSH